MIEDRTEAVRRALRARHAGVEPDPLFAQRVVARLPRAETLTFAWATRRVLPVTLALAAVLSIAVVATTGAAERTVAPVSKAASSPSDGDPLLWLLDGPKEVR